MMELFKHYKHTLGIKQVYEAFLVGTSVCVCGLCVHACVCACVCMRACVHAC